MYCTQYELVHETSISDIYLCIWELNHDAMCISYYSYDFKKKLKKSHWTWSLRCLLNQHDSNCIKRVLGSETAFFFLNEENLMISKKPTISFFLNKMSLLNSNLKIKEL